VEIPLMVIFVSMAATAQQGIDTPNGVYIKEKRWILILINQWRIFWFGRDASPAKQGHIPTRGTLAQHVQHVQRVILGKNV
jgi:hypothetical protein